MKRIEYYLKSAEIYSNLAISEQNFDRKTTYQAKSEADLIMARYYSKDLVK